MPVNCLILRMRGGAGQVELHTTGSPNKVEVSQNSRVRSTHLMLQRGVPGKINGREGKCLR